eukprot:jgi/Mesvir1/26351/Mv22524-RA.1
MTRKGGNERSVTSSASNEDAQNSSRLRSFFGGWGSSFSRSAEKPKKPVVAKLGEKNKFYYDNELKMWREEGAELDPTTLQALGPPPTSMTRCASESNVARAGAANGHDPALSRRSGGPPSMRQLDFGAADSSNGHAATPPTGPPMPHRLGDGLSTSASSSSLMRPVSQPGPSAFTRRGLHARYVDAGAIATKPATPAGPSPATSEPAARPGPRVNGLPRMLLPTPKPLATKVNLFVPVVTPTSPTPADVVDGQAGGASSPDAGQGGDGGGEHWGEVAVSRGESSGPPEGRVAGAAVHGMAPPPGALLSLGGGLQHPPATFVVRENGDVAGFGLYSHASADGAPLFVGAGGSSWRPSPEETPVATPRDSLHGDAEDDSVVDDDESDDGSVASLHSAQGSLTREDSGMSSVVAYGSDTFDRTSAYETDASEYVECVLPTSEAREAEELDEGGGGGLLGRHGGAAGEGSAGEDGAWASGDMLPDVYALPPLPQPGKGTSKQTTCTAGGALATGASQAWDGPESASDTFGVGDGAEEASFPLTAPGHMSDAANAHMEGQVLRWTAPRDASMLAGDGGYGMQCSSADIWNQGHRGRPGSYMGGDEQGPPGAEAGSCAPMGEGSREHQPSHDGAAVPSLSSWHMGGLHAGASSEQPWEGIVRRDAMGRGRMGHDAVVQGAMGHDATSGESDAAAHPGLLPHGDVEVAGAAVLVGDPGMRGGHGCESVLAHADPLVQVGQEGGAVPWDGEATYVPAQAQPAWAAGSDTPALDRIYVLESLHAPQGEGQQAMWVDTLGANAGDEPAWANALDPEAAPGEYATSGGTVDGDGRNGGSTLCDGAGDGIADDSTASDAAAWWALIEAERAAFWNEIHSLQQRVAATEAERDAALTELRRVQQQPSGQEAGQGKQVPVALSVAVSADDARQSLGTVGERQEGAMGAGGAAHVPSIVPGEGWSDDMVTPPRVQQHASSAAGDKAAPGVLRAPAMTHTPSEPPGSLGGVHEGGSADGTDADGNEGGDSGHGGDEDGGDEMADLLVCLGQETYKVSVLASMLQEHGVVDDVQALLAHLEEEYGFGGNSGGTGGEEQGVGEEDGCAMDLPPGEEADGEDANGQSLSNADVTGANGWRQDSGAKAEEAGPYIFLLQGPSAAASMPLDAKLLKSRAFDQLGAEVGFCSQVAQQANEGHRGILAGP